MSNPQLPREILDYTVDLLHDKPDALKQCCLASKSWVPCTRKYLFAHINFSRARDLEAWKKTFPDPANSPAYHTRSLFVGCPWSVTAADAVEGGWIRTFSRVLSLRVHTRRYYYLEVSLPFHNFSPVLKSLHVINSLPRSRIFNLICSLPLLEDLTICDYWIGGTDSDGIDFQPPTFPLLTGTLKLDHVEETALTVYQLLDLPGGLYFRELILTWDNEGNVRWITALVVGCSNTLECLDIRHAIHTSKQLASINFSKATRLKNTIFRCGGLNPKWIGMALQTITPEHRDLQQITIRIPYRHGPPARVPENLREAAEEDGYRQWMDLDSLLVQLSESRAIRTKVMHGVRNSGRNLEMCEHIESLLPGIAERGTIRPGLCGSGGSTARSENR